MKILLIWLAAFTLSCGVYAQEANHKKDHLMMTDGKMMMIKNGQTTVMDKDMTLRNGSTVLKNGMLKTKSGKTLMMKDGDMIYMNGKMRKLKMDKKRMPANHTH